MSKFKKTRKEQLAEKNRKKEIDRRYYDRNWDAMSFCLSHKLSVYPAFQPRTNRLKLFIHHHDKFKPVSDRLYDQDDLDEMKELHAFMDFKYEEFYEKHKHKGRGRFT